MASGYLPAPGLSGTLLGRKLESREAPRVTICRGQCPHGHPKPRYLGFKVKSVLIMHGCKALWNLVLLASMIKMVMEIMTMVRVVRVEVKWLP